MLLFLRHMWSCQILALKIPLQQNQHIIHIYKVVMLYFLSKKLVFMYIEITQDEVESFVDV